MKKILGLLVIISCFTWACKKSDDSTPNRPPAIFSVTPTLNADGKTVKLTWTKAKDPDGDLVTYTVFAKDTVAKNISDTTYTLTNLSFNSTVSGKIIAKDAKGLSTESNFSLTTATRIAITDANFEQALIDLKIDSDGIINGFIKPEDALKATNLLINGRGIKDLTGIEAFTNLTYLDCSLNKITSLALSQNTALSQLYCYSNPDLKNVDLSKNIALTTLYCDGIGATTLDFSKNIALQTIECNYNKMPLLDFSANTKLVHLGVCFDGLQSLNVTKNTSLQYLLCIGNTLTTLDVSKNTGLSTLSVISNPSLKTICVSNLITAQANTMWYKDMTAEYKVCL